ncbi:MAG: pyridoxamine 5'-phosphate oxidase [Rhodanobacteraceae bacterium]
MPKFPQHLLDRLDSLLDAARDAGEPEPTAMSLASHDADGGLSARIVLLKGMDERGLQFFTNYDSRKGHQLASDPEVALCLHFKHLGDGVQIRVEGRAEKLPAAESDAYFASRPRLSQIGAWASLQSRELPARADMEARFDHYQQKFQGQDVPRPPHWGGFVVRPRMIEFWHAQPNRLHERECWRLRDGRWQSSLLYP